MSDSDVRMPAIRAADVVLPSRDLSADLAFFTGTLGFRLDTIFPADDPAVATLSGHGLRVRLDRSATHAPGVIRLLCDTPGEATGGAGSLTIRGGTRVELAEVRPPGLRGPRPAVRPGGQRLRHPAA